MKKMRRLIPAVAMLMVAAVMLSTASFAWFTMNDQVTATGMQVQAKASGNLIISKQLMTATDNAISVDFGGTKQSLTPISLINGAWVDAEGVIIDPIYGTIGKKPDGSVDTLKTVEVTEKADNHFAEYVVYLATAGEEAIVGELQFDLDALVNAEAAIAPAYTVALYIVEDGKKANVDWTKPDATLNQLDNAGDKSGFVGTGVQVTIPSTYGKAADTAVGLMVVIRVYVDGALEIKGGVPAPAKKNIQAVTEGMKYVAETMKEWVFYTDADGTAVYDKALLQEGQDLSNVVASYWDGTYASNQENIPATYVNNTSVPAAGTSFSIDFKVPTND